MCASSKGHTDTVRVLVQAGHADVTVHSKVSNVQGRALPYSVRHSVRVLLIASLSLSFVFLQSCVLSFSILICNFLKLLF